MDRFLVPLKLIPFLAELHFSSFERVSLLLDKEMDPFQDSDLLGCEVAITFAVFTRVQGGEMFFPIADQGRIDAEVIGHFTYRIIELFPFFLGQNVSSGYGR